MKKIILALLAVLLVPALFFSADKSQKELYKNTIVIKDSLETKFQVELGAGWTADFGLDKKLNISGERRAGKTAKKANIKIGFDLQKNEKEIPAGYIEKIKKYYLSKMDPKLFKEGVKQSEEKSGKLQATRLEYQLNMLTSVHKFWQYIAKIDNEVVVIITCTSPADNFKEFEDDFKAIVDTMEFEIKAK